MDRQTQRMHLRAGAVYGRTSTCGPEAKPKVDYRTEERAERAAQKMSAQYGRDLEPYPCFWCGGWHIGREMAPTERETFTS